VDVTRTPAYLAAVASSAVPGLDAVAVRASRGAPGNRCDVGFVTDTQRRAWVVRIPTTSAVGAQLDTAADLLPLLHRRVPYGVPIPRGFLAVPEGRAVVYAYLHGRSVVLTEVVPGPGVAAEIGRGIAALHNVDRAVFDEAGVPVYDAETCRARHLADLDRGAATGHVPTALLSRWERALEDVSAWRFAPTPVHGDLTGGRFLVTFADEENPETASVRAVTGWEHAKVADPADDFAAIEAECSPETFESIVEAYSLARIERPDRHLRHRAKVVSELRLLTRLLDAVHAAEPPLITRRAAELRVLDEQTANDPDLVVSEPAPPRTPAAAAPVATVATDAAPEVRDDDTQLLKTGTAADPTAVIPAEELDRLRADSAGASSGDGDDAESWYEVLEAAPEVDERETSEDLVDEDEVEPEATEPETTDMEVTEVTEVTEVAEVLELPEAAEAETAEPDQVTPPEATAAPEADSEPAPEADSEPEPEPERAADTEPAAEEPPVTQPVRQRKAASRRRSPRRRR
jgi:aminoglycoside phosphotransferase (APT) family kinase protein